MLKDVFGIMLLVILLILPVMASGQEMPAGKWWYNPKIRENLSLSQNEIDQLDQLFANSRRKLIQLKSVVEREQFELDQLVSRKKVNDAAVRSQFQKLEQARKNLANERLTFVMGVRNILGFERYQQLKSNYRKWQ